MAQLAEQLTCNQQVIGSSPIVGLMDEFILADRVILIIVNTKIFNILYIYGWIPEWPKGADCKSVSDAFEGSNPSPSTLFIKVIKNNNGAGWSSLEARRAHNPKVIGSNPIPAIRRQIRFSQIERLREAKTMPR